MQVDVGELDQILELRPFTQDDNKLTETVKLPEKINIRNINTTYKQRKYKHTN